MSHAANHFHVAQSLLASIDGELCGLLKQVNKEANDDRQTFDKKWMPHLDRIAELATMHLKINEHYSNHLIDMIAFKQMCIDVSSIVSIPGMKPFPADGPSVPTRLDNHLLYMIGIASRVWNETQSYDIIPYDIVLSFMPFKKTFVDDVNNRINLCDKMIERIEWYIQTLQTLISNFDAISAISETKIQTMVKKILKPACVIFHITESDPLSTLKSLVQRATELLNMKEHPPAFSRTTIDEMIRDADRVKRRSNVHEMMAAAYASKPTRSQKTQCKMQSESDMRPDFHPKFHSCAASPHCYDYGLNPTFGVAAAEAEAAAEAAKRVAAAERRRNVHEMMATAYASKPTRSQKTQCKMQSESDMRPDFHPKFHSCAASPHCYDYGMYPTFGEAVAEAAEAAEAAAEEAAAVRLAFVKPKPKTKKCSLMGGRIKRKSKKRNSR
jgi:hypothetical protein